MKRIVRNRAYLFGMGVVAALMALGMALLLVYQFAQRERIMTAQEKRVDSVPALAFQSEREFLRLRRTLEVGLHSPQGPDIADLSLRYDIFLSRLALLRDNPSIALLKSRPEYLQIVPKLDQWAAAAGQAFNQNKLDPEKLTDLLIQMDAMGPDVQALSMAANSVVSAQVEEQSNDMLHQSELILWLTFGLLLLLVLSSIALVHRYRRQEAEILATEQLNSELLQARQKADAANHAKGQFLAHMSHELRTPFNGILGMLELLDATHLNPQQQDYIKTAQTSAQHLLALLNDILDVSALDDGVLSLTPEPVQLDDLLKRLQGVVQPLAQAKGIEFSMDLPEPAPPPVMADPSRFMQILLNLVQNAIKFTPAGWVRLKLTSTAGDAENRQLTFSVADSGIGIAPDDLHKLFRRFTQIDDKVDRRADGTGLGLEISQALARMMGGEITVQSSPGQGSTFTFSVLLPVAPVVVAANPVPAAPVPLIAVDSATEAALAEAPRTQPEPVQSQGTPHVLVVEDNPINQKLAVVLLQRMGCTVDCCVNGRDAVERVQKDRFSLVLMDVNMPVMDGLTATRLIRALEGPVSLIPVVVLTADTMNEARANALAAGANEFLSKPVQMQVLYDHLKRFIPVHL